jgi:transcriptional regulator GlxA family with amidase domain
MAQPPREPQHVLSQTPNMHRVAIVACDNVVPFDLSTPLEIFGRARLASGARAYEVRVCAPSRRVRAQAFTLELRHGLSALARADTIIVAGVEDIAAPVPPALVRALRRAAARGARIASVCSGAFVLAATGLLDGRRATTHWLATDALARAFPAVQVDANVLYVDEGRLLSSAGAAAAFDLCLHMIRCDHGASVAAGAARLSVMPLERDGGQSQFITRPAPSAPGSSLDGVLAWLNEHARQPLTLPRIAKRAAMSVRTFNRRFREQTGVTPLRWLLRARVRHAQGLLERTDQPIERVATDSGFGSVTAFREQFRRVVGTSPTRYRSAFRSRQ